MYMYNHICMHACMYVCMSEYILTSLTTYIASKLA